METETSDLLTLKDEQPEEVKPAPEIEPMEDKDLPGPFAVAGCLWMANKHSFLDPERGVNPLLAFQNSIDSSLTKNLKRGFLCK